MHIDLTEKRSNVESLVPKKIWFTLKEVCELKNLNYKTSCNKTYLQPNGGERDGTVGGRKVWSRETVIDWLELTDEMIEEKEFTQTDSHKIIQKFSNKIG